MAMLAPSLLLCASVLGLYHVDATSNTLSPLDSNFCHDRLEVIYPGLNINKCLEIPNDLKLREKITNTWTAPPQIYFPGAQKNKKYVLVMVDPDAPSHSNPTLAHWRHWLVIDIQDSSLKEGPVNGTTLTEYNPPSPPKKSGFHRYQFLLFEQPPDTRVTLTKQEASSRGRWNLLAFVAKFHLGQPVAAVQFLTQNYKD
ncbi:phosphatidylethanolamine-binding protein 4 [Antennarius striatus]|uniref:phosphatidylethanolamine-binding protein 4 n=1 Tax=Antennarius striatus TaxID=241820 RepID=UPI0035B2B082